MPGPVTKLPNGGSLQALYAHPIPNAPGKKLVAVKVTYEPGGWTQRHRHGNAFVTAVLLEGSVESGLNDEAPKTYTVGESWTENPGDIHSVSRNASKSEPASFIASFVCPTDQEEYVIEREEGSWAAACAAKARVGAYTSFDCPACEVAKDA